MKLDLWFKCNYKDLSAKHMGIIVYYIFLIINIILVIANRKSKIILWSTFLFLGLIFCSNECINGDWVNYKIYYDNFHVGSGMEIGYVLIGNAFKYIGLPFNCFLLFIYFICSFILYYAFKGYNINYHVLFSLIMPYMFPFLAFTLRYLIGLCVVIHAFLRYLKSGNLIKYLLFIIFASLFHRTMLLFVVLAFVNRKFIKKTKSTFYINHNLAKSIFAISIFISVITILNGNNILFLDKIIRALSNIVPELEGKLNYYLTTNTRFGFLMIYLIYFVGLALIIFMDKKKLKSFDYRNSRSCRELIAIDGTTQSFLILGIFLPFVLISLTFFRYFLVLYFMLSVSVGCYIHSKTKMDARVVVLFLLSVVVWFIPEKIFLFSVDIENLITHSFYFNWF